MERGLLLTGIVSLGLWFGGCGGDVKEPPARSEPVSSGKGVIRGTVSFDGDAIPPSPTLKMDADLSPGTYVVEAWHEQYGLRQATVTLGDDETRTIAFSFGAE